MNFWWAKAGRGLYYLRDRPGARGAAVGKVSSLISEHGGSAFYRAQFEHAEWHISFTERGQPKTIMAMLEAKITERFPDATFTREF